MRVMPAGPRFQITDSPSHVEVVMPARRPILIMAFMCAWLVGWGVGEVSTAASIVTGREHGSSLVFVCVWLVAWTIGGGVALLALAWMLIGREIVRVGGSDLFVRDAVGPLGRSREYELSHVQRLRVSPAASDLFSASSSLRWLGLSGGPVAFDYGARTYRFGGPLDDAEAAALVEALEQRVPSLPVASAAS